MAAIEPDRIEKLQTCIDDVAKEISDYKKSQTEIRELVLSLVEDVKELLGIARREYGGAKSAGHVPVQHHGKKPGGKR